MPAPTLVRYGANQRYHYQHVTTDIGGAAHLFGGDPDPTTLKDCDYILSDQTDYDGDSVVDRFDAFPSDIHETQDSDGDGVGDNQDPFPNDPDNQSSGDWV